MNRLLRTNSLDRVAAQERGGMALLLCIFVVLMVSSLVLAVLDTETAQLAAARNVQDYERALYLAGAAVHHACAELEADSSWRGDVTDGSYPNDDSYQATAVDGAGGTVVITASGVAGDVIRSVEATVEL